MMKEFNTLLILDWKKGNFRVVKSKPKNLKGTDLIFNLKLNVKIPEMKEYNIKGDIELSEAKASEIVLEEL